MQKKGNRAVLYRSFEGVFGIKACKKRAGFFMAYNFIDSRFDLSSWISFEKLESLSPLICL